MTHTHMRTITFRMLKAKGFSKMKRSAVQHRRANCVRQNPLGGAKGLQIVRIEGLIAQVLMKALMLKTTKHIMQPHL